MPENSDRPKDSDAVLGGQIPPLVGRAVLGGLAGVKQRFASNALEQRIAALNEAVKYGDAGLELIIQALDDRAKQVRDIACLVFTTRAEQLALLEKGVAIWNKWRAHSLSLEGLDVDLSGVKLSSANLSRANLSRANLTQANLSGANLTQAKFIGAEFIGANLIGANVDRANFSGADLSWTNLSGANLSKANVSGAKLQRAIMPDGRVHN